MILSVLGHYHYLIASNMDTQLLGLGSVAAVFNHTLVNLRVTSAADAVALILAAALTVGPLSRGKFWDKPDPHYHIYFERPQQSESNQAQDATERNIAKALGATGKKAVIFWGSQSGTAERLAKQLAKECQLKFGLETLSADLSDYDAASISDLTDRDLAIFLLSTYGEGDPSDNASGFWEWIHSDLRSSLSHLRYAAIGFGNSNYKYYNRVVDVVTAALDSAGAHPLFAVGKANEAQRSTEEDFLSWKAQFFNVLKSHYGHEEKPIEFQPSLSIIEDESMTAIDLHHGEPVFNSLKSSSGCSPTQPLAIHTSHELFHGSQRNCIHMELDLADYPEILYKTGDHLAIWSNNPERETDLLMQALGLVGRQDIPVSLKAIDSTTKVHLPSPTTIRALFDRYLEICAPVSRAVIENLIPFAPNSEAKKMVSQLSQDKDYYASYLTHAQLTLGRLLNLASPNQPWSRLPLAFVLESLPPMHPRYYSISSSSVLSPRRIAVTALVAADALPANKEMKVCGVTSNYILALSNAHFPLKTRTESVIRYNLNLPTSGDACTPPRLYAHVRKSKFKLPIQSTTPLVMVAAGTGLAPFRAFIAERTKLHSIGKDIGQMILFFGCRRPDEDFIYHDELVQMQQIVGEDTLKIVTAFSRESQQKVYVQDRVLELSKEVLSLIEEKGASFYICGRAGMAREVSRVMGQVVKDARGLSDEEVTNWGEVMKRRRKWQEDVWG